MKLPKIDKGNITKVTIEQEFDSNSVFKSSQPDEQTTHIDLDVTDLARFLEETKLTEMISDSGIEDIIAKAAKTEYVTYSSFEPIYNLSMKWNLDDFNFSNENFTKFCDEFKDNLKEQIDLILGPNLEKYEDKMAEGKKEDFLFDVENTIRMKVIEALRLKYSPVDLHMIFGASNIQSKFDTNSEFSKEPTFSLFSLSRNRALRIEQIKILEENDAFSSFGYEQNNNENLISIYLSDNFIDKFDELCSIKTKEVYKKINKKKNNFKI